MRSATKSWLVGVAIAVTPFVVFAQEETHQYGECKTEPTDADVQAAKGAFQAGQGSFNEADYNRAITYWEDAFRRDCTAHALLLNLARAYELNGQKQQAVIALQTYVDRNPGSGQVEQIQRRIDKLKEQIGNTPAATTAPLGTGTQAGQPPGSVTVEGPAPSADTGGKRPLLPLFVAGGGGVVFLVGGVLWLGANSDVSDFNDKCPKDATGSRRCPDKATEDDADSAVSKRTTFGIVAGVGAAVAAGGVLWYFLQPKEKAAGALTPEKKPRFTPVVGSNFAGLSYGGSF